jgi:hypothetical protein
LSHYNRTGHSCCWFCCFLWSNLDIPENDTKNTELEASLQEERLKSVELQQMLEENATHMKEKEHFIGAQAAELKAQAKDLGNERRLIVEATRRYDDLVEVCVGSRKRGIV